MVSETLTNTAKSTLSSSFISLSPPWFWGDGRRKAGGKRTTDFSSLSLLNSLLVCLCLSPAVAISKSLLCSRICAKTQLFRRLTVHRSWRRLVLGQMRTLCIESWCSTRWAPTVHSGWSADFFPRGDFIPSPLSIRSGGSAHSCTYDMDVAVPLPSLTLLTSMEVGLLRQQTPKSKICFSAIQSRPSSAFFLFKICVCLLHNWSEQIISIFGIQLGVLKYVCVLEWLNQAS